MNLPTVIVPVHNAFQATRACLRAVHLTVPGARALVVDDASTDARMGPLLERWVSGGSCRTLLRNRSNLGFVRSVNRAMERCRTDVVLLNSDTIVTPGWLDALARCLASDSEIATATPWSNNGEIVSYPEFCRNNPPPEDPEALANAISECSTGDYPELPTAVGFCMAISRRAIDRVGLFDADTFGMGYGEENDFSFRAAQAGMRNVLCEDAFVVHLGGRSFSAKGRVPDGAAMQRLLAKHPAYLDTVSRYIDADPLAGRRARIRRTLARGSSRIG